MARNSKGGLDLVIKNARVVTPTHEYLANLGIRDEKFAAVVGVDTELDGDWVIDAEGRYALPGIVDPHVHLGPRPTTPFEGMVRGETLAAAAGGITTMGLFVPYRDEDIDEWTRVNTDIYNTNATVDAGFHLMFTSAPKVEELDKWVEVGIPSWKLMIGYKGRQAVGRTPIDDGDVWEVFDAVSKYSYPAMVMVHAENPDIMLKGQKRIESTNRNDPQAWNDTRPRFVEEECMRMCTFLAKVTEVRLYIVHITIGEGVDVIADAKRQGINVIGETCPQYLTHTSANPAPLLKENPALANVNPPLRDQFSVDRLWDGLRTGVLDTVGSDHAAWNLAEKGTNIWKAPMGLGNTTEMLLPVLLSEGVNKGRLSLQDVVRVSCQNPALALGLYPRKGTIAVGSDGDVCLVDLEKEALVDPRSLHSRCDWNLWEGFRIKGWPVATILRGRVIYDQGQFPQEPGVGRFLPRYATTTTPEVVGAAVA